jgi:hypothetical protein
MSLEAVNAFLWALRFILACIIVFIVGCIWNCAKGGRK